MANFLLSCSNVWDFTGGQIICTGTLEQLPATTYAGTFDFSLLDPLIIAQSFGVGFGLVSVFAALGLSIKAGLDFLKHG